MNDEFNFIESLNQCTLILIILKGCQRYATFYKAVKDQQLYLSLEFTYFAMGLRHKILRTTIIFHC